MRIGLFFLLVCLAFTSWEQTREIDSLKRKLRSEQKQDTLRAFDFNELAWQYIDYSADSSAKYALKALTLSRKIGYRNGIVDAKNTQGIICRYRNQTDEALRLYEDVIRLRRQFHQEERLTGAYSNLGSVYYDNGNFALALKYYRKAFDNAVRFRQKDNQLILLNNIGVAYKSVGLYQQALDAFQRGLKMNKTIRDEEQEAQLYQNIATVYDQRQLFQQSVRYNRHAYAIFKRNKNIRYLSNVVYNLSIGTREIGDYKSARNYLKEMESIAAELNEDEYTCIFRQSKANFLLTTGHYEEALEQIDRALQLADSTEDPMLYGKLLLVKGDVFIALKRYDEAGRCINIGLPLIRELEDPLELSDAYMAKYEWCKVVGDYRNALIYFEKSRELKAQIAIDEVGNQIATLNSLNELNLKDKQIELANKEKEKIATENKRRYIQLIASLIIALLVLILLVFSWRAYRVKRKANEQLHEQKEEIEHQKTLIEEKQTEILDSIHYARRIQATLLAQDDMIRSQLGEYFIYFRPKDIVSGDFYWATARDDLFYLAICDSTGHGVPGAFMSLLNVSFLNEAINDRDIKNPNEVLDYVRGRLVESISQDGAQDGMDGVLLCFDRAQGTVTYSASYNKPLLVTSGVSKEYPADKMPVGKGEKTDSFTLHTLPVIKGSMLYLFTDGYADQFGGEKGKKFKYRQLEQLLAGMADQPAESQLSQLDEAFRNWKGSLEQIDDVTVVGIRIS